MASFKDNADAAVFYAGLDWALLPCYWMTETGCSCGKEDQSPDKKKHSPGKHPITLDGLKSATTDLDQIRLWWERTPEANIGMATGNASGMWVLDLDGPEGIKDFEELQTKHGPIPKTLSAKTGGGGRHLFFRMPVDRDIRNDAKIQKTSIDVRGTGGYVILAPSNHKSGNFYEWEVSPNDVEIAEAPQWLIDFVTSENVSVASPDREFQDMAGVLDCEIDPGAPDGKRHNAATRLIGHHLGIGEDTLTVYLKAMAWAAKCQPPLEEEEIREMVMGFYKKDMAKLIDEPSNHAPWPTLAPAALHGLAGEIVRAIEPHTESDDVAILVQLLTFFGCVIGRSPYFQVEDTRHGCNLFAVLVGETGKGKKGTALDRVRELFRWVDEEWLRDKVIGGLSSGEGFIIPVRDQTIKKEAVREGGKTSGKIMSYQEVITDHGVTDKRLLIAESEFSSVLSVAKREGNTLSQMVRQAWDSGNMRTLTRNNPLRSTNAHIALVGHITQEELLKRMAEVEAFNGFANRFLWLCVKQSKLLPEGGGAVDTAQLIVRLTDVVRFAKAVERMTRDAGAIDLWDKIYRQLANRRLGGTLGAVTERAQPQVLRLSMIYALLDMKAVIEPAHLNAALAVWQYAEDSAKWIFGNSTGDSLADRLLGIIRETPVMYKEIYKRTGNNLPAGKLHAALHKLVLK